MLTLVTDLPTTGRHAYVGIDNVAAGATAAYLLDLAAGREPVDALVPLSRAAFFGEGQRADGFEVEFTRLRPGARVVRVDGSDGQDEAMERVANQALGDAGLGSSIRRAGRIAARSRPSTRQGGRSAASSRTTSTTTTSHCCVRVD